MNPLKTYRGTNAAANATSEKVSK